MIITLAGKPGSGKSTVGRLLAEKLGYRFYSVGDLRGKMAMERGLTIDELNELGKREAWTDNDADAYQKKLGEAEDNFIIDSWAGFHFIPHSFKVFLDVDPRRGAERVFANPRPDERPVASVEETQTMLAKRRAETDARFKTYYGFSCDDQSKFDLIIDTTSLTPDQIVEHILTKIQP